MGSSGSTRTGSEPTRPFQKRWVAPLLLALIVGGVLAGTLAAPLFLDDFAHLLLIREGFLPQLGYNTYGVAALPREDVELFLPWWTSKDFLFNYYRPVTSLLLAADQALWGSRSWGYHLSNLVTHVLACLLLFWMAMALGLRRGPACATALLFGLHFYNLWSVYWVSSRCDLVALCLALAALIAYHGYAIDDRRKKPLLYGLSFGAMALGILAKEIVFALFVVFALHDLLLLEDVGGISGLGGWGRFVGRWARRGLVRVLPFALLSGTYLAWYLSHGFGARSAYVPMTLDIGLAEKLGIGLRNLVLFPATMATYLPPVLKIHENLFRWPLLALSIVFVLASSVAALWLTRPSAPMRGLRLFALAWTLLFLAPTLGFYPSGRYLYFASVGFALLVGSALQGALASRWGARHGAWIWSAALVYVAVGPATLDILTVPFLNRQFEQAQHGIVKAYREKFGEVRDGDLILLLNVPNEGTPSVLAAAYRFYNPGKQFRVWALTSFQDMPSVEIEGDEGRLLTIHAPEGHHFFESPGEWIYLTSFDFSLGQVFRTADFEAMITAMDDGGRVTEMRFRFQRPLSDERVVVLQFRLEKPVRPKRGTAESESDYTHRWLTYAWNRLFSGEAGMELMRALPARDWKPASPPTS